MAYDQLGDFLSRLQDDGELRRISGEVDPEFEITEILRRLTPSSGGAPAVLFEQVRGSAFPLVVNLLGSEKRIGRALGVSQLDEVSERVARLLRPDVPENWFQKLKLAPQASQTALLPPQTIKNGVCQHVVKVGRDVDLDELPALRSWPGETRRCFPSPLVMFRDPDGQRRFVERFPLQIVDRNTLAACWDLSQTAGEIFEEYRHRGTPMPVAIVFGGDPVLSLLAAGPIPAGLDPLIFAGFLRNKSLDVVKCRQLDLEIPAQAELVIEGYIDPREPFEPAGPLAGPHGYDSPSRLVPHLHVAAMTHRSNPVLTATIPGLPQQEEGCLAQAHDQWFLAHLSAATPGLTGFYRPPEGQGEICFVSLRKRMPYQARAMMHLLWGHPRTMSCKLIVAVDDDVDLRNSTAVWAAVAAHLHPPRDVIIGHGPAGPCDPAAPFPGAGGKLGLDATRKRPEEGHPNGSPAALTLPPEVVEQIQRRTGELRL